MPTCRACSLKEQIQYEENHICELKLPMDNDSSNGKIEESAVRYI